MQWFDQGHLVCQERMVEVQEPEKQMESFLERGCGALWMAFTLLAVELIPLASVRNPRIST